VPLRVRSGGFWDDRFGEAELATGAREGHDVALRVRDEANALSPRHIRSRADHGCPETLEFGDYGISVIDVHEQLVSGTRTGLDSREYPWRFLGRYRELDRISPQTDVAGGAVAAREPHVFLEPELAVELGYTLDISGVDHRERAQGHRIEGYPRTVARELLASGAVSACALLCPNGGEE